MRVNIYAEEITDRIEIVEKTTLDGTFTGIRFYLELPVTIPANFSGEQTTNIRGPFHHNPGDDDSAAVTFWGKTALRETLTKAIEAIDEHYNKRSRAHREAIVQQAAVSAHPLTGAKIDKEPESKKVILGAIGSILNNVASTLEQMAKEIR